MTQSHPLQHAAAAARAGNPAVAKIHLQKAAEVDPENPAVWLWMGWLSDSPLSMIQSLEMLLADDQYSAAAEAGIQFARTLAEFRPGQPLTPQPAVDAPVETGTEASVEPFAATPPQPVRESSVPPGSEAPVELGASVDMATDHMGTMHSVPENDTFEQVPEQPVQRTVTPEIVFDNIPETEPPAWPEPAAGESAEAPPEISVSPDDADVSEEERDIWADLWDQGADHELAAADSTAADGSAHDFNAPDSRGTPPEMVSAPGTTDVPYVGTQLPPQLQRDFEPVEREPVVLNPPPAEGFRAARADWFSPDGAAGAQSQPAAQPPGRPAATEVSDAIAPVIPESAPGQPQWARAASLFEVPAETPAPQNALTVTSPDHSAAATPAAPPVTNSAPALPPQPSAPEPPPVWQQPSERQAGPVWQNGAPAITPQPPAPNDTEIAVTAPGQHHPHELTAAFGPGAEFVEVSREPEAPEPAGPANHTVLIVDDSPTVRKLVAMTLEKKGYQVVTAFDGVAAIKEIAAQKPGLVLMDCNMPRLDGYQLCKLVKKHESTRHIPVVMLSGKDGVFDRLRGRMVGCAGSISKPFVPEELAEAIAEYLPPPE